MKASFLFAAILCEISGGFLIFPPLRKLKEGSRGVPRAFWSKE